MKNFSLNNFFVIISLLFFSNINIWGDAPFRDHRYDSFKVLAPQQEGNIVFIGNSITDMMNWNELFGDREDISNRGVSGAYTSEVLDNLEYLVNSNPSKIFLMIGTNDLGTDGEDFTPQRVSARIGAILERLLKLYPNAQIYYQSILPTLSGKRTKAKTEETNARVKKRIETIESDRLHYIDLYSHFADEDGSIKNTDKSNGPDAWSYDGLHLTQKGYRVWGELISPYIGSQQVIPENAPCISGGMEGSQGMKNSHYGVFPVKTSDILMLGDEFIKAGEWNELLNSSSFKNRGNGWGYPGVPTSRYALMWKPILEGNSREGVLKETPAGAVIYMGAGDIIRGKDAIQITKEYKLAVDSLQSLIPDTPIFLMTLAPLPSIDVEGNNKIKEVNENIGRMAEGNPNIILIDFCKALTDEKGSRREEYFTASDQPYINGDGYLLASSLIADAVNKKTGSNFQPISMVEGEKNRNKGLALKSMPLNEQMVFDNTASFVPYRIPVVAENQDGDLIAVADYRYSKADIGMVKNGKLDIRYRIRDGKTGEWGDIMTLLAAIEEGDSVISFGDPVIVADRESNRILITSCSGNISFPKGTHSNHQGWVRLYSEDGGKSWSDFIDISPQVFAQLDSLPEGPIRCFFIASGKMAQSRKIKKGDYYRLYCAALVKTADNKNKNYVFYSDDFGENWLLLGDLSVCPIPLGGDEAKIEELPDGNVLISSRTKGGRLFNIFTYTDPINGEGNWTEMARSSQEEGGLIASANACNGEIMVVDVTDTATGEACYLLLQSVPFGPEKRSHVGINYKALKDSADYSTPEAIARSWEGTYIISPVSSAYSSMVQKRNGDIAFIYEEGENNGGYDIMYQDLPISIITSGKYEKR